MPPAERHPKSLRFFNSNRREKSDPGRGAGSGYGAGWWLANTLGLDEFGGNGRGGQRVAVWPEKDTIAIFTGAGYPANEVAPAIVKSLKSDGPLPENAEGGRQLAARVANAAKAPAPVSELPAMARTVSGATYAFPRNPSRLDGLQLNFNGRTEAQLKVKYLGPELSFPVGLDGVYRLGPYGPLGLLAGATGRWTSDTDFLLDLNFISNINHYTVAIHFEGDQVQAVINESSGLVRNGRLTGRKV